MLFKIIFGGLIGCMVALISGFLIDRVLTSNFKDSKATIIFENHFLLWCFFGFVVGAVFAGIS